MTLPAILIVSWCIWNICAGWWAAGTRTAITVSPTTALLTTLIELAIISYVLAQ